MTDVNGVPILSTLPQPAPGPATAVVEIPIDLEHDQTIVEMKLRAPGVVRAAGYWGKKPSVLGSASMRAVEMIAMPLLFVECDPAGELQERVFLFLPSGRGFTPRDGFVMQYRATAVGQVGAMHVFEIVEVTP